MIIFGPTGKVGSIVARIAQENGAKVHLAMRDTQKVIPGLSAEQERSGKFTRVQADLTNPDTVTTAVKATGSKRAFIYVAHGAPDHMRASIAALKTAGVEFVVFLSSCTVVGELKGISPSEVIPYMHAQVEINLHEIFGAEGYVALRCGYFATNMLWYKEGIDSGDVRLLSPSFKADCITPVDMGCVGGTILVNGPRNGQREVYLYGPQLFTKDEAIGIVGRAIGRDLKVTAINEQEGLELYMRAGVPKPVAEYVVRRYADTSSQSTINPFYEVGVENVQLYKGRPALRFEEWVEANKQLFTP